MKIIILDFIYFPWKYSDYQQFIAYKNNKPLGVANSFVDKNIIGLL